MHEWLTPIVDLVQDQLHVESDLLNAIARVLRSGRYVLGDELVAFESELAARFGVRHIIGVNSGTSALHLALIVAGATAGTEVITTPLTFVASGLAIKYVGAVPRFVDVDPLTWNIDPEQVEQAITERTRAVLAVHLHGRPCDMQRLQALCAKYGLTLIEDAAHAHGALLNGLPVGALGDVAAFSFYPTKVLGGVGQGGAVATDSMSMALAAKDLRSYGTHDGVNSYAVGFNYRLDEIQSAALRVKLPHLDSYVEARRGIASTYTCAFSSLGIMTPCEEGPARHSFYVYAIRHECRDSLRTFLTERGIGTGIHYPTPLHFMPPFREDGYSDGQFPNAERCAREFLSLPIYPSMDAGAVQRVVEMVSQWALDGDY
jgi:dTDP-4-amino-4,6-dideoxygalactose transaminase